MKVASMVLVAPTVHTVIADQMGAILQTQLTVTVWRQIRTVWTHRQRPQVKAGIMVATLWTMQHLGKAEDRSSGQLARAIRVPSHLFRVVETVATEAREDVEVTEVTEVTESAGVTVLPAVVQLEMVVAAAMQVMAVQVVAEAGAETENKAVTVAT